MFKMDAAVSEYLHTLGQDVDELRQLGVRWGLDNESINKCIRDALDLDNPACHVIQQNPGNAARKVWKWMKIVLKLVFVSCLLTTSLVTLAENHKPTQQFVVKFMQPYTYPILRMIRLATLPIHKINPNITYYYTSECFIENPFFKSSDEICHACMGVEKLLDYGSSEAVDLGPGLVKSTSKHNLGYHEFKEFFLKNKDDLEEDLLEIISSDHNISTMDMLFERNTPPAGFHIEWKTRNEKALSLLHQLFPPPEFASNHVRGMIEGTLLIDGPKAEYYELLAYSYPEVWYMQASTKRKVYLNPGDECLDTCISLNVTLKAGDVLRYNNIYTCDVLPNGDSISIAYMENYLPQQEQNSDVDNPA